MARKTPSQTRPGARRQTSSSQGRVGVSRAFQKEGPSVSNEPKDIDLSDLASGGSRSFVAGDGLIVTVEGPAAEKRRARRETPNEKNKFAKSDEIELSIGVNEEINSKNEFVNLICRLSDLAKLKFDLRESDIERLKSAADALLADETPLQAIPKRAPDGEIYSSHAKPGEDVVGFLNRVYGQRGYLTGEFTRADLRKIDPSAMTALNNWEKGNSTRPRSRAPLNLPTVAERNDRYVAQGEIVADDPKETARRAAAAVYRMTRKPKF